MQFHTGYTVLGLTWGLNSILDTELCPKPWASMLTLLTDWRKLTFHALHAHTQVLPTYLSYQSLGIPFCADLSLCGLPVTSNSRLVLPEVQPGYGQGSSIVDPQDGWMATSFMRHLQSRLSASRTASSRPELLQLEAVPRVVPFFQPFLKRLLRASSNPLAFHRSHLQ